MPPFGQGYDITSEFARTDPRYFLKLTIGVNGVNYRFLGGPTYSIASAGDVDGDGKDDLILGFDVASGRVSYSGATYLMTAVDLAAADATDGAIDGTIYLDNIKGHTGSYQLNGYESFSYSGVSATSAGDVDGDGQDDLIIGAYRARSDDGLVSGGAYLITAANMAGADAADGTIDSIIDLSYVAGQTGSYQFVSQGEFDNAGRTVASAGDVDGDGKDDVIIGVLMGDGGGKDSGEAYLITAIDMAAADAKDGTTDGVIDLNNIPGHSGSYHFIGTEAGDAASVSIASAGDVDGDGLDDLIIGANRADGGGSDSGEAYLIVAADLAAADAADGTTDGVIDLGNVSGHTGSYRFTGAQPNGLAGTSVVSAGDVDGDGKDDLFVGAPLSNASGRTFGSGGAYLVTAADLAAADAKDGTTDGVIDLGNVAGHTGSYQFVSYSHDFDRAGDSVASAGDVDGDGKDDLVIGVPSANGVTGQAYVIAAADMAGADAADGTIDGIIYLQNVAAQTNSFEINGIGGNDRLGTEVASAGDVDGDGKGDILFLSPFADGLHRGAGATYLMTSVGLIAADAADGTADGVIQLVDLEAVAQDDAFSTDEETALTGLNVFADNGFGPDTDSDSSLNLSQLNDLYVIPNRQYYSDSGALLSVNADGSLNYDPKGLFEYLPTGSTAVDTFWYELNVDSIATVSITIHGVDNNDVFLGTSAGDVLDGGQGDDVMLGGRGNDMMEGGVGNDVIHGDAGNDTLAGDDGMDTINGGAGADWIDGGSGSDRIFGARGDDMVLGGDGGDYLKGSDGNDTIDGGAQSDRLFGGEGQDVFIFSPDTVSMWNRDWIYDWQEDDRIDLSGFSLIGPGETTADAFAHLIFVQSREHTGIKIDGYDNHSIVLDTTSAATLDVDDFIF